MMPLSYSVLACDRKTKDVYGQVQFNINCNSFVIAIEVCKDLITSPSINYGAIRFLFCDKPYSKQGYRLYIDKGFMVSDPPMTDRS